MKYLEELTYGNLTDSVYFGPLLIKNPDEKLSFENLSKFDQLILNNYRFFEKPYKIVRKSRLIAEIYIERREFEGIFSEN